MTDMPDTRTSDTTEVVDETDDDADSEQTPNTLTDVGICAGFLVFALFLVGVSWTYRLAFDGKPTLELRTPPTVERATVTEPVIVETDEVLGEFNGKKTYAKCLAAHGDIVSNVDNYGRWGTRWAGEDVSASLPGVGGCKHGQPLRYEGTVKELLEDLS